VKLVGSLDHQGNMTDHFLRQMDLVTTVSRYPHNDEHDTTCRAAGDGTGGGGGE
jgi:microcystin degradation protein MlrC